MDASFWLGISLLGVGVVACLWGYGRLSLYRTIAGTPTSDVADVDRPGVVELRGTAKAAGGETITAPLSGQEALAAGWRVEEWDQSGEDSSHWQEKAEGYDSVPFGLDDGTAAIAVYPGSDATSSASVDLDFGDLDHSVRVDDATVDFRTLEVVHQSAPGEEKPDRIDEFEGMRAVLRPQPETSGMMDLGKNHGERRYYEGTIEPGDEVYLLGRAVPQNDAASSVGFRPENAVVEPSGDGPFVLSQRSESELRSSTRLGLAGLAGGVVSCLAGLAVLLL